MKHYCFALFAICLMAILSLSACKKYPPEVEKLCDDACGKGCKEACLDNEFREEMSRASCDIICKVGCKSGCIDELANSNEVDVSDSSVNAKASVKFKDVCMQACDEECAEKSIAADQEISCKDDCNKKCINNYIENIKDSCNKECTTECDDGCRKEHNAKGEIVLCNHLCIATCASGCVNEVLK